MIKKTILASLLWILCLQSVHAAETNACQQAMYSTMLHYTIGDGKDMGVEIKINIDEAGNLIYELYSPRPGTDPVTCWMYEFMCGGNLPPGDAHDIPGTADCTGCTRPGSPGDQVIVSLNEMKCCLKWASTSPPAGQSC